MDSTYIPDELKCGLQTIWSPEQRNASLLIFYSKLFGVNTWSYEIYQVGHLTTHLHVSKKVSYSSLFIDSSGEVLFSIFSGPNLNSTCWQRVDVDLIRNADMDQTSSAAA